MYSNMYISWWVYFLTGLTYVLQQPLTGGLAKTKADITWKTSHSYLSHWSGVREYGEVQSKIVWSMPAFLLLLQSYWIEGSKRKIKTSWWWTMSFDIARRKTFFPLQLKVESMYHNKKEVPPNGWWWDAFFFWAVENTMYNGHKYFLNSHNMPTNWRWKLRRRVVKMMSNKHRRGELWSTCLSGQEDVNQCDFTLPMLTRMNIMTPLVTSRGHFTNNDSRLKTYIFFEKFKDPKKVIKPK